MYVPHEDKDDEPVIKVDDIKKAADIEHPVVIHAYDNNSHKEPHQKPETAGTFVLSLHYITSS